MKKKSTTTEWIAVGCVTILLVGVVAVLGIFVGQQMIANTPSPTPEPVVMVVTATSRPATRTPESTSTPRATPTDTPTATPTNEPTATPEPTLAPDAGYVTTGGNMRESPDGAVLGQVCPDDTFTFLHAQGDWYTVRIDRTVSDCAANHVQPGYIGWIHKSLLTSPVAMIPTTTPPPATPTPEFIPVNQTQRIGPIYNSLYEEEYSVEITLEQIKWFTGDGEIFTTPKSGNMYVIAYIKITNLGPDGMRSIGSYDFEALDANGVMHGDDYLPGITTDCDLETVDLVAGGTSQGCVAYEVPDSGKVDLIFAPYQHDNLAPGRYLAFNLRP